MELESTKKSNTQTDKIVSQALSYNAQSKKKFAVLL